MKKKETSKKFVGAHVSVRNGVWNVFQRSKDIGAKAAALFLKNQRTWKPPALPSAEDIAKFHEQKQLLGFSLDHVLPHGSYLVNLGNCPTLNKDLLGTSPLHY